MAGSHLSSKTTVGAADIGHHSYLPSRDNQVFLTSTPIDVTHQPRFVSSSSFTIIMYSILATALLCLWIWLVSIASQRIRRMPTFTILTLATLAYCIQTMLEVSRTVDLLTGKVVQDRERPVAIVFFLFAVPWISDWTFVPRLLAFFPSTIHSTRRRLLVIALPVTMKIVRAVFIALFTLHTYQTTHGPPLDEETFYRKIAFSTAFPQLEWIAIILDEGYCTAFLIAHLMLFKRGHIRSQPLLSAVQTVILASVATFALPLAFCCTSISLQYAHMNPKITRDAWVAAEFVIVLGAYGSCVAPTIRSEKLAKRSLIQRQAITPDGSDAPPPFALGRITPRTNGASRIASSRGKMDTQSALRSSPGEQSVVVDLEMGSFSFSHLRDTPPTSSIPQPVYSDCMEMVQSTPPRRSSFFEHEVGISSSPETNGTSTSHLLKRSNSLKSLSNARYERNDPPSLPTLVRAHEPDLTFRLEPSPRRYAAQQANHLARLASPQDGHVTFHLPSKITKMEQDQYAPERRGMTETITELEVEATSKCHKSQGLEDKKGKGEMHSEQEQSSCNGDGRRPGTPESLPSPYNDGIKRLGATPSARPWTSTGAPSHSDAVSSARCQLSTSERRCADITESAYYDPHLTFDLEMPFAGNFAPSSPCRHSDSELRGSLHQQARQQKPHLHPIIPMRIQGDPNMSYGLFSSSEVLLPSPTRTHAISGSGWGGECGRNPSLHKALPAKPDSAVAPSSSSPSICSISTSQLSPPNSAGGIVRKGKLLAINTAIANKFLLRPGSASADATRSYEFDHGVQQQKRKGEKEPVAGARAAGRRSPTTSNGNAFSSQRGPVAGLEGRHLTTAPPLSCYPIGGHLEIAIQRTTRVEYASDEGHGATMPVQPKGVA